MYAQDSLININLLVEQNTQRITEKGNCDLSNLEDVVWGIFEREDGRDSLESIFSKFYVQDPNIYDIDFLQYFINFSYPYRRYLSTETNERMEVFYKNLRKRLGTVLVSHQYLLIKNAKTHFHLGNQESGYGCLAEVIKLYFSRFPENDSLNPSSKYGGDKREFFQASHKAFILFLSELPVSDYRFKMFCNKSLYSGFRNGNNQQAYLTINKKLDEAGYLPLEIPDLSGVKRKETANRDDKKMYSTKDEWIKKQ